MKHRVMSGQARLDLLLAALRGDDLSRRTSAEWACLAEVAVANGLGAYLGRRLRTQPAPEAVRRRLRTSELAAVRGLIIAESVCQQLGHVLASARVPFMPMKGALLRYLIYPERETRTAGDVDILVPAARLADAERALEQAGFHDVSLWPACRRVSKAAYHERHYAPPAGMPGCEVDLHQAYCRRSRHPVDYDGLWRRGRALDDVLALHGVTNAQPFGPAALCMAPEDVFVELVAHAAAHVFDIPLRSLLDIKLLLERLPLDWDCVVRRTREAKLSAATYLVVVATRRLLGAKVDPVHLREVRPSLARRRLLQRFVLGGPRSLPASEDGRMLLAPNVSGHGSRRAALGVFLIDGVQQQARFVADYGLVRLRDLVDRERSGSGAAQCEQPAMRSAVDVHGGQASQRLGMDSRRNGNTMS